MKQHLNIDVSAVMLIKSGGGPAGRKEMCPDVCICMCCFCVDHTSLVKASLPPREKDSVYLPTPWFRFLKQCFMEGRCSAMSYFSQLNLAIL